jgi:hypothetical protein
MATTREELQKWGDFPLADNTPTAHLFRDWSEQLTLTVGVLLQK